MKNSKLLSTLALGLMLTSAPAFAATDFNDVPEEEVAKAVVNVLRKNPKIVYEALQQFYKDRDEQKANYNEDELTPLEQKIAVTLKERPILVVNALQIYDQEKQQEELLKTAEIYKKHIAEINQGGLVAGNPDGKYTLVEFFDFSCGYCKQMAPRIKNMIAKNPDLKVIFKPVAFLSPISEVAAKASVAAANQGKFLEMYSRLMGEVRVTEPTIDKIAKELGLDMEKYKKDKDSKETAQILEAHKKTADNIEMKSVPTLVLNGMPLYAIEEVQLQHAIDVLRNAK